MSHAFPAFDHGHFCRRDHGGSLLARLLVIRGQHRGVHSPTGLE